MYKTKWCHLDFCLYKYFKEFASFGTELMTQMREILNPGVKLESYKNY